jgi:radical SAM superfamily enzyme YgiQ (UPF0313 family)
MCKALLVYPEYPDTFWSFKYALKFIHKKASFPPLGLLTVAAMLPEEWETRLADLNVSKLSDAQLSWADYVLISAMDIQRESTLEIIGRCRAKGIKMIAGGPLFTASFAEFPEIDHLVLNEAEITLPRFLNDLKQGKAGHIYATTEWADVSSTPLPKWSLIDMRKYATMNVQYSRGCPYDCEFCDVTLLYGHQVRTKSRNQIIDELRSVHEAGWDNGIFIVDDNFIGNKPKLKTEILPAITEWQRTQKSAHTFITQVSIELADDPLLQKKMVEAGFNRVFVGIESPNEESLKECNKFKNENRDLLESVETLQRAGLEVSAGFIVGFDHDSSSIFDVQLRFIQRSGIVTAMVGLLQAFPETKLYQRLHNEKRILQNSTGNNTDFSLNFIPRMKAEELISGYKTLMNTIYSPKHYYARVRTFLKKYKPAKQKSSPVSFYRILAFFQALLFLGVLGRTRYHYWKSFFWTLFCRPRLISNFVTYAIYGFHFSKILKLRLGSLGLIK